MNERFGPYILLKRLGIGGMAEIWLAARQAAPGVRKLLALKCILPSYNDNPDFVRLFYHEAGIALRMQHPNIINTWDCSVIDGRHTMCMDYLHGVTLQELLERIHALNQPFKPEYAVWIAIQILEALQYLHTLRDESGNDLRIVHRDISPQNIFICHNGQCKLFDFGVARMGEKDMDIQQGMIIGKPAYISPEQCQSEPLDGRSDTFSLAVILYEMATGRSPFQREDDIQTLNAVMHSPVTAPNALIRDFPAFLSRIIMQGIERTVSKRYASAADFANDLRTFLKINGHTNVQPALAALMHNLFAAEIAQNTQFLAQSLPGLEAGAPNLDALIAASRPIHDIAVGNVVGSITVSRIKTGDF